MDAPESPALPASPSLPMTDSSPHPSSPRPALARFVQSECSGWKPLEVAWLSIATLGILAVSLAKGDGAMNLVAGVTGVLCVVLTGKGKLSAYPFGMVNCLLYAFIAYGSTFYGETMLNLAYYAPMNLVGFLAWRRHMDQGSHEVVKRSMGWRERLAMALAIVLLTVAYGFALRRMGDRLPFVDSFTTVTSVVAAIVSIRRFAEQWWIWIAVDVFTVYMWWQDYVAGTGQVSMLAMWTIYLLNAVIMLVRWTREANRRERQEADHAEGSPILPGAEGRAG